MDRTELSSAIIQEMQALVGEALEAVVPALLTVDLATLEQRVQQVGRVILGGLVERVAAGQAQGLPRPARCPDCHGPLKRRERPRPLVGLVGDYTLHRAYYWCAACRRGTAPLDAALGLGAGRSRRGWRGWWRGSRWTPPSRRRRSRSRRRWASRSVTRRRGGWPSGSGRWLRHRHRRRSRAPSTANWSGRRTRLSGRTTPPSWWWRWMGCWSTRRRGGMK